MKEYEVYRRTKQGLLGQWSNWNKATETTNTSWTDNAFTEQRGEDEFAEYRVKAQDKANNLSTASATVSSKPGEINGYYSKQEWYSSAGITPGTYGLSQNSPNPFNPTTTIGYQLPEPSTVTLRVYNLRGKHLVTLKNTSQPAGFHSVRWDGTGAHGQPVASGTYLYHLSAQSMVSDASYNKVQKMLYLK